MHSTWHILLTGDDLFDGRSGQLFVVAKVQIKLYVARNRVVDLKTLSREGK